MLLLIDAGNTSTKCCLYDIHSGYQLISATDALVKVSEITAVVYSSVSDSEELKQILDAAEQHHISTIKAKVSSELAGLTCGYENVSNLGIDRWLAVIATDDLFQNEPAVIVDAGTAMTVDFITQRRDHLGGWIAPGLRLMQDSIVNKAPGVFSDDSLNHNFETEVFANDTPKALLQGVRHCLLGSIERAVAELQNKVSSQITEVKLVITGGDAEYLCKSVKYPVNHQPLLVFKGLKRYFDICSQPKK